MSERAPGPPREGRPLVVIYTRPLCTYCFRAKRLLKKLGVAFEERSATSPEVRASLLARTGSRTVPQVFADDEPLGGFDELAALHRAGALASKLSPRG